MVNGISGDGQVNDIVAPQSGLPRALTTARNNLKAIAGTQRPNWNSFSVAKVGRVQDHLGEFLEVEAFSPGPYNLGNVSRPLSDMLGPLLSDIDLSEFKSFSSVTRCGCKCAASSLTPSTRLSSTCRIHDPAAATSAAVAAKKTTRDRYSWPSG